MTYIGAGVLPYYFNNGQIHYILGQDQEGQYSDFGGRPETNESIETCAARECAEEMGTRFLGEQVTIKSLLRNSRFSTPLSITKENGKQYHLYLLRLIDSRLWIHQSTNCHCFKCTFTPNNEKVAITSMPADAVYEAVAQGTGQITLGDRIFTLRDVFINEIRAIPAFQALYPTIVAT